VLLLIVIVLKIAGVSMMVCDVQV